MRVTTSPAAGYLLCISQKVKFLSLYSSAKKLTSSKEQEPEHSRTTERLILMATVLQLNWGLKCKITSTYLLHSSGPSSTILDGGQKYINNKTKLLVK